MEPELKREEAPETPAKKETLTTKSIAGYCQVTQRTVVKWINEGKLKSFRTPGKHIRVNREDFLGLLNKYHMPVPQELDKLVRNSGKKKILVVDDDQSMVDAIKRVLLKEKAFELDVAYDGFTAGQKFVSNKPDLIILDLHMPGINGHELCADIRKEAKNNHVKILAISGIVDEKEIEKIMALGADDYLLKPFDNKELKTKVTGLFGWRRRASDVNVKV